MNGQSRFSRLLKQQGVRPHSSPAESAGARPEGRPAHQRRHPRSRGSPDRQGRCQPRNHPHRRRAGQGRRRPVSIWSRFRPTPCRPICKILDFGKYRFQEQKKQAEARKKQKVVEVKEIKLRPMIDDHDYQVKMRSMERFFEEGDKVKVTLRFRGREMAHQELGTRAAQPGQGRHHQDGQGRVGAPHRGPPDGDGAGAALTAIRS